MKDRFSEHSQNYASFRPLYPPELFDHIFRHVNRFDLAWDAGTGNGQAARVLARVFKNVVATDISAKQIEFAERLPNIEYSIAAENSGLPDHTANLITVAQAIHWFDRDRFYEEVSRAGAPGALLAVWGYGLISFNKAIDPIVTHFYKNVIGPYWDKERKHIDDKFQNIRFPYKEITSPHFEIKVNWNLDDFRGYLGTWSAVRNYISERGNDPVPELIREIKPLWARSEEGRFEIFLRMGKVS